MRPSQKGQMLSAELVIASGFFIAAMVIFVAFWTWMYQSYQEAEKDYELQTVLLGISDMAVLSGGDPANWNALTYSNTNSYGIASSPNMLSDSKASALAGMNGSYDAVKERMGAGAFDVYLRVYNSSGIIYSFGKGADLNNSLVSAVSSERLALLNDSLVSVRVQVWRLKGRAI